MAIICFDSLISLERLQSGAQLRARSSLCNHPSSLCTSSAAVDPFGNTSPQLASRNSWVVNFPHSQHTPPPCSCSHFSSSFPPHFLEPKATAPLCALAPSPPVRFRTSHHPVPPAPLASSTSLSPLAPSLHL